MMRFCGVWVWLILVGMGRCLMGFARLVVGFLRRACALQPSCDVRCLMGFARWVAGFLRWILRAAPILRCVLLDGFRAVDGGVLALGLARCTHPTMCVA